jgi:hypothetical protein
LIDCDEVPGHILDTWHVTTLARRFPELCTVVDWLVEQEGGHFYWTLSGTFWFEYEEDCIFFSLTWN